MPFGKLGAGFGRLGAPASLADAPTKAPNQVSNLALWLVADQGVTKDGSNLVGTWADQSGNLISATELTNKPLWVNSLVNGKPVIRFDGVDDKLLSTDFALSQPFFVFAVWRDLTLVSGNVVIGFDNDASAVTTPRLAQTGTQIRPQGNSLNGSGINTDTTSFHLWRCLFSGTSTSIALNNGSPVNSGADLSGGTDGLSLGARFSNLFTNVEIAEVAIYSIAPSGADFQGLLQYFKSRYGLW